MGGGGFSGGGVLFRECIQGGVFSGVGSSVGGSGFCIIHLINAEFVAKFCTTRETRIKWTKIHFNVISTYVKIHHLGFQMNYNAFCFGEKKWI